MLGGKSAAMIAPGERLLERVVGLHIHRGDASPIGVRAAERVVVGRHSKSSARKESEGQESKAAAFPHSPR